MSNALFGADRDRCAVFVARVLDRACHEPLREGDDERQRLGYYLSPGTGSWDALVEAEAILTGEDHAVVARARFLDWQGDSLEDRKDQRAILTAWSNVVARATKSTLVPTAEGVLTPALVVARLGAWAVTRIPPEDGEAEVFALTWGPLGLAADIGTREAMAAHLDELVRLRDHSRPGIDGGAGGNALELIRTRNRAAAKLRERAEGGPT